jgi:hypothetical protein
MENSYFHRYALFVVIVLSLLCPSSKGWASSCLSVYKNSSPIEMELSAYYVLPGRAGHFETWHARGDSESKLVYEGIRREGSPALAIQREIIEDVLSLPRAAVEKYESLIEKEEHTLSHRSYGQALLKAADQGRLSGIAIKVKINGEMKIVGGISVNDGTDYLLVDKSVRVLTTDPTTPLEFLLENRKTETQEIDQLRKKGMIIYELSKYMIDESLPPHIYKAVRKQIWRWFYDNYLRPSQLGSNKVVFLFDVFSERRKDATVKTYGARVIPPESFQPRLDPPNYILISNLKSMRAGVRRIIR